jgi:hypothetical protein
MKDEVNFLKIHFAISDAGHKMGLDPRLVALVQFMARRAAEHDFALDQRENEASERAGHSEDET